MFFLLDLLTLDQSGGESQSEELKPAFVTLSERNDKSVNRLLLLYLRCRTEYIRLFLTMTAG